MQPFIYLVDSSLQPLCLLNAKSCNVDAVVADACDAVAIDVAAEVADDDAPVTCDPVL